MGANLHPIAERAGRRWFAKRQLDAVLLDELRGELDALRMEPALGYALQSLMKLAAYVDGDGGDRRSADLLMALAMEFKPCIDEQNRRGQVAKETEGRRTHDRLRKFTGVDM